MEEGLCYNGSMDTLMKHKPTHLSLQEMKERHYEIARRLVLGQSQAEISRTMNISQSRLSVIKKSPLFKRELVRLSKLRDENVANITLQLQEVSPIALGVVESMMYTGATDRIKLDAAQDLLDRAGYGKIQKSINVNTNINQSRYTDDELKRLILSRIGKQQDIEEAKAEELDLANTIEVDFGEDIDEQSDIQDVNAGWGIEN